MRLAHSLARVRSAARSVAERGRGRAQERIGRPVPAAEPQPLGGADLARKNLGDAAVALVRVGATQAEAFRLLRLELNRLEQGGLRALLAAAPPLARAAELPSAPPSPPLLPGAFLAARLRGLRERLPTGAARALLGR